MRLLTKVFVALVVLTLLASSVAYLKPSLLPAGPLHPRSIVYRMRGERLHPWIALRPDRKYVIKFWDVKWPVFRKDLLTYDGYLEYVIQAFMADHPNVRVEVRLLDLRTDEEWLMHALNTGDFPDVLSAPFDPWFVERGFLADLTSLFDQQGKAQYIPSTLSAVTYRGRIWAIPRWLDIQCLVANARMLAEAGIDPDALGQVGWNWEQFATAMARLKSSGVMPFIPNSASLDGLKSVAESLGAPPPFDSRGNLIWSAKDLEPAVTVIKRLQAQSIIPSPPGKYEDTMLEIFWSGKAAAIGPFGSGMLRHVRERRQGLISIPPHEKESTSMEIALLPVPSDTNRPAVSAGLMSLMVFDHPDPERMKAAADFARFLATGNFPKITEALQVVSCYLPNVDQTLDGLVVEKGKVWIGACLKDAGPAIDAFDTPLCPPSGAGVRRLGPAVRVFWAHPGSAEALVESLHKAMVEPANPRSPRTKNKRS